MIRTGKICPICWRHARFKAETEQKHGRERSYIACRSCNDEVPIDYLDLYGQFPPGVVSAVGYTEHGKTVYFAALFFVLREMGLENMWPRFYTQCLDDESVRAVYGNVQRLKLSRLPQSTTANVFAAPTMLRVDSFPRQKNCTLLMYDIAGEHFRNAEELELYGGFVKRAKTVLFFFSLPEAEKNDGIGNELVRLVETYRIGMSKQGIREGAQDLVLVYTMADQLGEFMDNRWGDLKGRLACGKLGSEGSRSYLKELKIISTELREFTEKGISGRKFLRLADNYFRRVSFCGVSSLGAAPPADGDELEFFQPRRVLDPLIYVMRYGVNTKGMGAIHRFRRGCF